MTVSQRKFVIPIAKYHNYEFPTTCPFHPSNDRYELFFNATRQMRKRKWKCELCGKYFSDVSFLDRHMETKHDWELPGEGGCVADLCPLLQCHPHPTSPCSHGNMQQWQNECHRLLWSCVPPGTPQGGVVRDSLTPLCAALQCPPWEPWDHLRVAGGQWTTQSLLWIILGVLMFFSAVLYYTLYAVWGLPGPVLPRQSFRSMWRNLFHRKVKGY